MRREGAMWTYHPDLLATAVPRYTSFPTAAEFGDDVGPADMEHALARVHEDEPVSLYLHIPYCHEICWYCGCNTGAANRAARVATYVQRLGEEVDLVAARLAGRGRVTRIAWGGGSPNALVPAQFDALMHRIRDAFACTHATVSVELDPRGFDWGWAECLARNRVTRASLGVQTFAPHIQHAIGRVQPVEAIACAMGRLRAARIESINFDLMYGLPGQFAADLEETLDIALSMRPERFAVFGYAHVPHLLPRQRRIDATRLPGPAARFALARQAHRHLRDAGYDPIGFDHFAVPQDAIARAARSGTLRRNFQGFTEDQCEVVIGLGASAVSAFPGALLQNETRAGRYHRCLAKGRLATARGIRRSPGDRRRSAIIEALLCRGEAECTGLSDLSDTRARLARFEERGLLAWAGTRLLLDRNALPYARAVAAAFDPWRAASAARFSSAV